MDNSKLINELLSIYPDGIIKGITKQKKIYPKIYKEAKKRNLFVKDYIENVLNLFYEDLRFSFNEKDIEFKELLQKKYPYNRVKNLNKADKSLYNRISRYASRKYSLTIKEYIEEILNLEYLPVYDPVDYELLNTLKYCCVLKPLAYSLGEFFNLNSNTVYKNISNCRSSNEYWVKSIEVPRTINTKIRTYSARKKDMKNIFIYGILDNENILDIIYLDKTNEFYRYYKNINFVLKSYVLNSSNIEVLYKNNLNI